MGKLRKTVLGAVCLMTLSGGTVLYAASGKSEIALYLNNVLQKQTGLLSEGVPYLPVKQLAGDLHALLSLDESGQTVRLYKPNVNLVLIDNKGKIFGKVRSGIDTTFSVLVQVDHLKTDISDMKILLIDPAGTVKTIDNQPIKEKSESFWFKSVEFSDSFNAKGAYTIQVYMKASAAKEWSVVSEMEITTI
ncbi:hypothetical protein C2I18_16735 [Paenibacillus sp. PK3_47]|uniref:hypothetical protein n=1 Tax=Paenibacillus sp. PK3_47 TaxID=2072642 RepID=UPI00201E6181|nr:hypothetical protein [Paenibacillus sp. PK3_47]UQZ35024.1 hypothetical protein C2I18_16735 [Paenibacillus sp. PK3_47]